MRLMSVLVAGAALTVKAFVPMQGAIAIRKNVDVGPPSRIGSEATRRVEDVRWAVAEHQCNLNQEIMLEKNTDIEEIKKQLDFFKRTNENYNDQKRNTVKLMGQFSMISIKKIGEDNPKELKDLYQSIVNTLEEIVASDIKNHGINNINLIVIATLKKPLIEIIECLPDLKGRLKTMLEDQKAKIDDKIETEKRECISDKIKERRESMLNGYQYNFNLISKDLSVKIN